MVERNLITDVAGVRVGHAHDERLHSGVTAIIFEEPAVASIDVRGGGPGTRETDLLEPAQTVERIDGLAFSGGSAFGLEAGGGVQAFLREQGRGYQIRGARVPIVPGAILFDLLSGGDKNWGRFAPYRDLGYAAASAAAVDFALGSAGAGLGATTANLQGGVGSASDRTSNGHVVGALAVVNAAGSAVIGDTPNFWAAPFERDGEYGGLGLPSPFPVDALKIRTKGGQRESTTLVVVATDAILTKSQAKRLAVMAQTGLPRAIYPVHTALDGDVVFAAATGRTPLPDPLRGLSELGAVAANTVARAVARGVYEAKSHIFAGAPPSWRDRLKPGSPNKPLKRT
jgi:L-aminopeptidase/D-esterase-like protein